MAKRPRKEREDHRRGVLHFLRHESHGDCTHLTLRFGTTKGRVVQLTLDVAEADLRTLVQCAGQEFARFKKMRDEWSRWSRESLESALKLMGGPANG